jgi:glycosyltransferase 2 family protein
VVRAEAEWRLRERRIAILREPARPPSASSDIDDPRRTGILVDPDATHGQSHINRPCIVVPAHPGGRSAAGRTGRSSDLRIDTAAASATTNSRRIRLGAIGLVISAASILVLATNVDLAATMRILAAADPGWLVLTLLMVPTQILLRALRWRLLLPRRPDGERPAVMRVAPVLLVGYLGNLVLPARLGELVRTYLVARREELRVSAVLGSVLLERVLDLASLALVAFVAALAAGAPSWMVQGLGIVAAIGVGSLLVLVGLGLPRVVRLLARLTGTAARRFERPVALLVSFGEGAGGGDRRVVTAAILLSSVTWLFVATTFWLVGQSLGLGLAPSAALLITAVTVLGTAIPSAPGHIGTFQVAAVVTAGALGIPPAEALALALLAHVITTLPMAAIGVASLGWMSISLRGTADEASAWRDPALEHRSA